MKKMNKKGFIMVETLIVTVFVVTLFILIYQITVPALGEYESIYIYDDIDSIYASDLYKQMLTRYGNLYYVEEQLKTKNYLDVSDCSNTNVYSNSDYCNQVKKSIGITDRDYIFITKYDISSFKNEVRTDEKFDSGNLSNFRNYINTVPNIEKLMNKVSNSGYNGRYRLFITRTILEADGTSSRRYVNVGVYTGNYEKFLMGEKVYFNPTGTNSSGNLPFFVLKNSLSTEESVTLIYDGVLANSSVCFLEKNYDKYDTSLSPQPLLKKLKSLTDSWTRANSMSNYMYNSKAGYSINYSGYRARLIDEDDIIEVLGCKTDGSMCFSPDDAFLVENDDNLLSFLTHGLTNTNGYWTGIAVPNSNLYAWSIKKTGIVPTSLSDCLTSNTNNIGITPVIEVKKEYVSR